MFRRLVPLALCASLVLLPSVALAAGPGVHPPVEAAGAQRGASAAPSVARPDALDRALASGGIDGATYALQRARSLFDLDAVRAAFGDVAAPGPWDATLVLRDLVAAYPKLTAAQRGQADSILARPTDSSGGALGESYSVPEQTPYCSTDACYHWVASSNDAPDLTDANSNSVPDYVDTVTTTLETVWTTEVTNFKFRAPKSDLSSTNHGPDQKLDIYLADVGANGYYGYCTTDDPHASNARYPYYDESAYCVIDNDFSPSEFPAPYASGTAALQVTLAHEFFHAVQFAYDYLEDRWWMEATAVWMEDEVFPDVNDNLQYLADSPLTVPRASLDANKPAYRVYGDWIFYRYISELFAANGVHDVSVIRHAWRLADGAAGGRNMYSLQAVAAAVKAAGVPFRELFADFGMVNDVAPAWYQEGQANHYPVPPLADDVTISRRHPAFAEVYTTKHLTNAYVEFSPGRRVSRTAHLLLSVHLPDQRTGAEASVVVISSSGRARFKRFSLDVAGDGRVRVAFGRTAISRVDLVLTNASTRTHCWVDRKWTYSCAGQPLDDGLPYRFAARLVQ